MTAALTPKQEQIYNFLKSAIKKRGYPPTVREICDAVELSSTSTVHSHLRTLERKGYIRREPSKNRSIEILETDFYGIEAEHVLVPVVGEVTAGVPILAVENIEEHFPIPTRYVNDNEVFMLRVRGDSMLNAGILHRDMVLVRKQATADNGDIVVALLDDSATVKRFFKDDDSIRLQPENPAYMPIVTNDVEVLGKVIGLFRSIK
jgi:repressor LexA